jgi:hypothetical protein
LCTAAEIARNIYEDHAIYSNIEAAFLIWYNFYKETIEYDT